MTAYIVIPGIDGSDERHWQSLWENQWGTSAVRIAPASWSRPDLPDWVAAVQTAYETAYETASERDGQVALVAHSLGCWAAAQWLDGARPDGVTAFLVAPPDLQGPAFPREAASTFLGLSARPLPCRSLMVASDDDPYCDPMTSAALAKGWQAERPLIGSHGHINSDSGLGDWQVGQELLRTLVVDR
ncbi:putative alpha/beta hydrolase family esterase [Streptomyces sp. V3I8]|uniref:RBBP9/YdeN family alpha/beta hydrolase n=1 Tax=Streptomyces sp. V3I8 TaxID=3042279 RepID=UPI002788434C|nr:alpha/beta hydrolase [Streptomyces sp. V3I8]MDQ1041355.1 putative alpha/beta hydrolase family esterase [Streptomyces sp. V3I8]